MLGLSSPQRHRRGVSFQEKILQARPSRKRGREIKAVDYGQAKTARRHRMPFGCDVLVEGDLHAGNATLALDGFDEKRRRMAVTYTVGAKQHDAVAAAAIAVGEIPDAALIEPHHRVDP